MLQPTSNITPPLSRDKIRTTIDLHHAKSTKADPPPLTCPDDIWAWKRYIQNVASACSIQPKQYFAVGLLFIRDSGLLAQVEGECERRDKLRGDLNWENYGWDWSDFLDYLQECVRSRARQEEIKKATWEGAKYGAKVACPVAESAVKILGFGKNGVDAGSLASKAQSAFYGGETSGVFSTLQSVGAKGLESGGGIAVVAVTGAVLGAAVGLGWGMLRSKFRKRDE